MLALIGAYVPLLADVRLALSLLVMVSSARPVLRASAFRTFLRLPDPPSFAGDADAIASRWRANAETTLAAELDGGLVGSNVVTGWGSVGFFGPLTVRPDAWDRGIATRPMEPTLALPEGLDNKNAGPFTFPNSAKHLHLYQKFGMAGYVAG